MGFPITPIAPCRLIHPYNGVSLLFNTFNGERLAREISRYNFLVIGGTGFWPFLHLRPTAHEAYALYTI